MVSKETKKKTCTKMDIIIELISKLDSTMYRSCPNFLGENNWHQLILAAQQCCLNIATQSYFLSFIYRVVLEVLNSDATNEVQQVKIQFFYI